MFRRMYYLLPNADLTQKVVADLYNLGVKRRHIHALSNGHEPVSFLAEASPYQKQDSIHLLEDFLWRANIALFFVALVIAVYCLIEGLLFLSFISLSVSILTFFMGDFFVLNVPHVHQSEFQHAINHNEILLMVDIKKSKVAEIEDCIHRRHPALIEGGSCWSLQFMGL